VPSTPPVTFFLPVEGKVGGQRLCIFHAPARAAARSAIVYVHPFAEEQNKARRMAALQARALAAAGHAVLQIDLLGCGDSSGDFADATWSQWLDDVVTGTRWLLQQVPGAPLWLWGLRGGCLLAADVASRLDTRCSLLMWAPVTNGKLMLQQFLRMKTAAERIGTAAMAATRSPGDHFADGQSVEVGGYLVSPALAAGLEAARLAPSVGCGRLEWIEVSNRPDASLAPASGPVLASWRAAGIRVETHVVPGPAFWQTAEIETAPSLLALTSERLCAEVPCAA
jgi:exosortase A-associated hydrolase 2